MKKILFLLLQLTVFSAAAQFITLQGKQFLDGNGQPFYPVALNYSADAVIAMGAKGDTGLYCAPTRLYGASGTAFECDNITIPCSLVIARDFLKIKRMGFNCIRLVSFSPKFNPEPEKGTVDSFYFYTTRNHGAGKRTGGFYWMRLPAPYTDDERANPILHRYLRELDEVIAIASDPAIGLKIFFDVSPSGVLKSEKARDEYRKLLIVFGRHFRNNRNLMAYVLLEEPWVHYSNKVYKNKEQVSRQVREWYDALKTADPNHLIANGGLSEQDLLLFDPAIMKMDFYMPHPYVYPKPYEEGVNHYPDLRDRVNGWYYWLEQYCSIPWMVGETSISAWDTAFPVIDCSLEDQADFAASTLKQVYSCGGSGYTWWQYQEAGWTPKGRGYGLLRRNLDPWKEPDHVIDKPAVRSFQKFSASGLRDSCVRPESYFDPFNHRKYSMNIHAISGKVVDDATGLPIAGAMVRGYTYMKSKKDPATKINAHTYNLNYTFTDENGSYAILPFDHESPKESSKQWIQWMMVTASGYETLPKEDAWTDEYGFYGNIKPANVNPPGVIRLKKVKQD